jgi:hypothetical protein
MTRKPLQGRPVSELERDYRDLLAALEEQGAQEDEVATLRAYQLFVQREGHWMAQMPSALWALAHAEPRDSVVRRHALAMEQAGWTRGRPWFRLLHPLEQPHDAARLRTLVGHQGTITAVALSLDGKHAVSGSSNRTLIWWDLERGRPQGPPLQGHQGQVTSVALSSDGKHALSGSDDKTLIWWDLKSGTCVASFPCPAAVASCALGPNDRTVAARLRGGQVLFFRLEEN